MLLYSSQLFKWVLSVTTHISFICLKLNLFTYIRQEGLTCKLYLHLFCLFYEEEEDKAIFVGAVGILIVVLASQECLVCKEKKNSPLNWKVVFTYIHGINQNILNNYLLSAQIFTKVKPVQQKIQGQHSFQGLTNNLYCDSHMVNVVYQFANVFCTTECLS